MSTTEIPAPLGGLEARPGSACYGVLDHGAQVFAWTPEGGRPALWMSGHAVLDGSAAIRGGVPVCFPWFGAGPRGDMKPAHGFARLRRWRRVGVQDMTERDGRLIVDYRFDPATAGPSPEFPHDYVAALRVDFARDYVQIDLDVRNVGSEPFAFEAALHSYLAVADIRQTRLSGLDGAAYLDKAPGAATLERVQAGDVVFEGETDRIYLSPATVEAIDPAWGRRLIVSKGGAAQTVVWNPWIAKAKAMADFGDEEWTGMVCVEAAAIGDHAVRLAPGGSWKLWQRIATAPL